MYYEPLRRLLDLGERLGGRLPGSLFRTILAG
jgi:hypothetical protein